MKNFKFYSNNKIIKLFLSATLVLYVSGCAKSNVNIEQPEIILNDDINVGISKKKEDLIISNSEIENLENRIEILEKNLNELKQQKEKKEKQEHYSNNKEKLNKEDLERLKEIAKDNLKDTAETTKGYINNTVEFGKNVSDSIKNKIDESKDNGDYDRLKEIAKDNLKDTADTAIDTGDFVIEKVKNIFKK